MALLKHDAASVGLCRRPYTYRQRSRVVVVAITAAGIIVNIQLAKIMSTEFATGFNDGPPNELETREEYF